MNKINEIDRFETCLNLAEGGLTPTIELFQYIKDNCNKEQVIMIRNKNNFVIESKEQLEEMKNQIKNFLQIGGNILFLDTWQMIMKLTSNHVKN